MKQLATLFALLMTTAIFGQEEVVIIDRSKAKESYNKQIRKTENVQVFKFAPISLFDGEVLFGYERQLTAKGSFDVELGPTISKVGFGVGGHLGNLVNPQVGEEGRMGVVLGAAYRYYPLDETEALNRFYVSPQFRFKVYNHSVVDYSGSISEDAKGKESMANFFFNFGYQSWISETFSIDYYFGIGIGQHSGVDYSLESYYEGNEAKFRWKEDSWSGTRYVLNLGIKVGIGSK